MRINGDFTGKMESLNTIWIGSFAVNACAVKVK